MAQKFETKGKDKDKSGLAQFLIISTAVVLLILFLESLKKVDAVVDRIVAIVNEEIITLSEIEKYAEPFVKELKSEDPLQKKEERKELYGKILDKLIEEKLLDQEAKKLGIKVTSKEIEAAIEDIRQRNNLTQEELEKALEKEGLTLDAFKKQVERRLQNSKLINLSVKVDFKIDEKRLREFYQNNIELYKRNELYRPAHIFFVIPKDASPNQINGIKKRCQTVLERIKRGEDFGELALLYSEDPSSKDRGDLGYFKKGDLLPAIEKEALRLKVGEVSGMIRSEFGFHIIKLIDRKGGDPIPFEEVIERVKKDFIEREMDKGLKKYLSTLKEKSVIEIKL